MRVLVAGASSVPGLAVLRELMAGGHEAIGLTRAKNKAAQIAEAGARPIVADVFDAAEVEAVVGDVAPEVVISLLTTLPRRGPMRWRDFGPAQALWGRGVPNLVTAAQRAGVRRIVAESVIFAYGFAPSGPPAIDESTPHFGPAPRGGSEMLAAIRAMEQTVLTSGEHSGTEGIVLRYGAFYGAGVPHTELMTRLVKWWALPVPTGNGVLSWVDLDDVARATVSALDQGRGGELYNIVDDDPMSFHDYVRGLTSAARRPPPLVVPRRLFGLLAPYTATAFGEAWLPVSNAKAKAELNWKPTTGSGT
jgi:nucleoside-diphosphate-sugar epimerase